MANILFLDDEERILNTYKRMIRSSSAQGYYARSSKEALIIIKDNNIDLIVSDYRLEQETGLDFLKLARKQGLQIPMVIISGYAEESLIKNAIELNIVQSYLLKPINLETFVKLMKEFLPEESI